MTQYEDNTFHGTICQRGKKPCPVVRGVPFEMWKVENQSINQSKKQN